MFSRIRFQLNAGIHTGYSLAVKDPSIFWCRRAGHHRCRGGSIVKQLCLCMGRSRLYLQVNIYTAVKYRFERRLQGHIYNWQTVGDNYTVSAGFSAHRLHSSKLECLTQSVIFGSNPKHTRNGQGVSFPTVFR